jgi:pyruvate/2-oxoglutarate/acetoin dehydrogenase E1 component
MQLLLGSLRGMYLCTPRNMVQAAGMYTTLLQADEPAVVIECLNGYRLKENLPTNLGSFTVPLGRPEILRSGNDATVLS